MGCVKSSRGKMQIMNGHGDGKHVHDCQDENMKITKEDKTEKQYQQQECKHRKRKKQKNKKKDTTGFRGKTSCLPGKKDGSKPKKPLKQRRINYVSVITGNTLGSHELFLQKLHEHTPALRQVSTVDQSDVILVFCPIVSRVGTDIEAALKQLINVADSKPAVLVVLYNTFEPECVVPDSTRYVSRENMIIVDCLFYEGQGLWQCGRNSEAVRRADEWITMIPSSKSNM